MTKPVSAKPSVGLGLGARTVLALVVVFAVAITVPGWRGARNRANQRACYANQKTIAGYFEMYGLEPCDDTDDVSLADVFRTKYHEFQLPPVPDDPGCGSGSSSHYVMVHGSIACLQHGPIQAPREGLSTVRDELAAAGMTKPGMLAQAPVEPFRGPDPVMGAVTLVFLATVGLWWFWGVIAHLRRVGRYVKGEAAEV